MTLNRKDYHTFENPKTKDEGRRIRTESESEKRIRLKRELGLIEGVSITLGSMIGSGIFISPKGIVANVHSIGLSLVIWVTCGILSAVNAICYTELGTAFPSSGGDYHYLFEAFGPIPAFLYVWVSVIIFIPCQNAILALAFGQYVLQPLVSGSCLGSMPDIAVRLLAGTAISSLTFLNCYGVKSSAKVQNVFSSVKLGALFLIIIAGLVKFLRGNRENFDNAFENSSMDPGSIALAFYSGIYAYGGANTLNTMTEEVKNPTRTLPWSIYISVPIVICVYVLANTAYFTAMTQEEMLKSEAVAVTFAESTLGIFAWVISVCVAISTFGGLSVNIMKSSRILFAGARNGHFPVMLSHIQYERRTPIPALLFLGLLSLLYLTSSDILELINYHGFMLALVFIGAALAFLYLRWSKPDHPRPVKVHLIFPILYLLISLFLFLLPMYVAPKEAGIGCVVTLSGLPIYYLVVNKPENKPEWVNRFTESATILVQKLFLTLPTEDD